MARYISSTDMIAKYGQTSIAKVSNSNEDDDGVSPDTSRIDSAISYAEDRFDESMRKSRYVVPVSGTAGMPKSVIDVCVTIAYAWLHEMRGLDVFSAASDHPLAGPVRAAFDWINDVTSGRIDPGLAIAHTGPTAPRVMMS